MWFGAKDPSDPWLPRGYPIGNRRVGSLWQYGSAWQMYSVELGEEHVLVATERLFAEWRTLLAFDETDVHNIVAEGRSLCAVPFNDDPPPVGVAWAAAPQSLPEALAMAQSLRRSRALAPGGWRGTGIYCERRSVILHDDSGEAVDDRRVLVRYLTGGVEVDPGEASRITSILGWLPREAVQQVFDVAGIEDATMSAPEASGPDLVTGEPRGAFSLPGRQDLEIFLQEHVVDIVVNHERYSRLGIGFPGSVLLYGPPGTGKTFAIDRLAEYLGWPRFDVSSESIGSPYIHETSKKVGEVFARAAKQAPAIVVIDEMDAFLAARDAADGSSSYRVEEVSEFLRQIPLASKQRVLLVGMTNRLDAIDSAILRRGRFDHLVEVGPAGAQEIAMLLVSLLKTIPHAEGLDVPQLAERMNEWPLSDVSFVVREAARLAARDGLAFIDTRHCERAVETAMDRRGADGRRSPIGF